MVKLATVSIPYDPTDKQWNIAKMDYWCEKAAEQGVNLIVFPEECVGGVGTRGMNEFFPPDKLEMCKHADIIPGEVSDHFCELAKKYNMYIVYGCTEQDPDRWTITHNCAVLVGPEGYIGKHRKVHFPLSERQFHVAGDDYEVFDTSIGKIGLIVCYDVCFPEAARVCALKGADILCIPIAWPNLTQTLDDPDHHAHKTFAAARALENMIFVIESNVCNNPAAGAEGAVFEGHSQIYGPNPGQFLGDTGFEEGMTVAEVDIRKEIYNARIFAMGGDDLIRDRRPSTYGKLVARDPYANYQDYLITECDF